MCTKAGSESLGLGSSGHVFGQVGSGHGSRVTALTSLTRPGKK